MIRDHFLLEDLGLVIDNQDNLIKQVMNSLESAAKGDFTQRENILKSINDSLLMLQALNTKKKQREAIESGRMQHI